MKLEILVIAAVCLLVLMMGCVQDTKETTTTTIQTTTVGDEVDVSECNLIDDQYEKYKCYRDVAVAKLRR